MSPHRVTLGKNLPIAFLLNRETIEESFNVANPLNLGTNFSWTHIKKVFLFFVTCVKYKSCLLYTQLFYGVIILRTCYHYNENCFKATSSYHVWSYTHTNILIYSLLYMSYRLFFNYFSISPPLTLIITSFYR